MPLADFRLTNDVYAAGASIASLALLAAYPVQIYVVAISMSLEKWCSITFIAQLNSRDKQYKDVVDGPTDALTELSAVIPDNWSSNQTLDPDLGKRMDEETDLCPGVR